VAHALGELLLNRLRHLLVGGALIAVPVKRHFGFPVGAFGVARDRRVDF
jgi:hypothetical protein